MVRLPFLIILLFLTAVPARGQDAAVLPDSVSDELCPLDRLGNLAAFAVPAFDDGSVHPAWSLPVEPSGTFRLNAPARVFLTDPADGDAVEVVLQGLLGDGLALDGEFVRAGSDRLDGQGKAARAEDGDFRFEPDTTEAVHCITDLTECPSFDAVNVYYHVDHYAREFWEGRMGVDITFKAEARVHVAGDGGFADWNTRSMKVGVGNIFMKNGALSDDLIYHEYNHLVMASLGFEAGAGTSEQTRALHEAYADYFMATWTDDPRIAEWLVTCPPRAGCEGPPNDTDLRTMVLNAEEWNWRQGQPSESLKYGICTRFHEGDGKCKQSWNNFTNPYVWGMIWGAALWDLRTSLGPEQADRIALEAVRQHDYQTDFAEAHAAIVQTGHDLFGPNVGDQVRLAFEQRGFLLSTGTERFARSAGSGRPLALELWPNPAGASIRLRTHAPEMPGPMVWVIEDVLGRVVRRGGSAAGLEWTVDVSSLPPGLYRARVRVHTRVGSRSFLITR